MRAIFLASVASLASMASVALVSSAVVLLPARASAQTPPPQAYVSAVNGDELNAGFRAPIRLDTMAVWQNVPGTATAVYARVKQILDSLQIPYTQSDSARGLIMNRGFTTRGGRLAGKVASASLRCGFGPSGDYADTWRVTVVYAVFINPSDKGGTRLGSTFIGQAKDLGGSSSPAVFCASKGRLEAEIARLVRDS